MKLFGTLTDLQINNSSMQACVNRGYSSRFSCCDERFKHKCTHRFVRGATRENSEPADRTVRQQTKRWANRPKGETTTRSCTSSLSSVGRHCQSLELTQEVSDRHHFSLTAITSCENSCRFVSLPASAQQNDAILLVYAAARSHPRTSTLPAPTHTQ